MGDLPDLVIIDGGKGQLNAALGALAEVEMQVSICGLAKENEELFLPGRPTRSCCRGIRRRCFWSSGSGTRRTGSRSRSTGRAQQGDVPSQPRCHPGGRPGAEKGADPQVRVGQGDPRGDGRRGRPGRWHRRGCCPSDQDQSLIMSLHGAAQEREEHFDESR